MPGARVESADRVTFRTVEEEDAPFVQHAHANPALRYPLGWDVKSRHELEGALDDDFGYDDLFLVCLDGEDAGPGSPDEGSVERIGCVVAGTADGARTGIGFWIVPDVHGEG